MHEKVRLFENEVKKVNEIGFLQLLLEDATQELEYKKLFDESRELAIEENGDAYKKWIQMRSPSVARIEADLKMIRRISIQLERGLRK